MDFGRTPEDIERHRKVFLIAFYVWTGSVFLLPLGAYSLASGRAGLGFMLLANAAIALGAMAYSRATDRVKGVSFILSVQAGVLAAFLVIHGGIEGSGVYFSFSLTLMMITLGFSSMRLSAYMSLGFLGVVASGLYGAFPGGHDYPDFHKSRILMGLAAICMMAIFFEWIRGKSYAAITHTAEKLDLDASHDPLTGLLNRRGFENNVNAMDDEDFPAVLAIIDIDHFKKINDENGHAAGDATLRFLGGYLRDSVKGRDLVCRWGGEEFLVLFTHLSFDSGSIVLDQIRDEVSSRTITQSGKNFHMTFSAGVVEILSRNAFLSGLKMADQHLYHAKRSGRNRVVCGMVDADSR